MHDEATVYHLDPASGAVVGVSLAEVNAAGQLLPSLRHIPDRATQDARAVRIVLDRGDGYRQYARFVAGAQATAVRHARQA